MNESIDQYSIELIQFPFTVKKILIRHPEFNSLRFYGDPRIIRSAFHNMDDTNKYLSNLSIKRSYQYEKVVKVILTLVDNSELPFVAYINPQLIRNIIPKIIEYYAMLAIWIVINIAYDCRIVPFSVLVLKDYLENIKLN